MPQITSQNDKAKVFNVTELLSVTFMLCKIITQCNHTNNPAVHMTKRDVGFLRSQLQNSGSFGAALLSAPV